MSREKNALQNHNTKTDNKSFATVASLKYLAKTLTKIKIAFMNKLRQKMDLLTFRIKALRSFETSVTIY